MRYNYKKLLSEKQLLKVKQRARGLMRSGTDLLAIYYAEKKLVFKTRSSEDKNIIWTQTIEITDATIKSILNATQFNDVESIILNSGIKVHCTCPAWKMWGMQYKGTRLGYSLVPEKRKPTRGNRMPNRIPYLCKHLYLVLQVYPFWSKTLASKFRNYYKDKETELEEEDLI